MRIIRTTVVTILALLAVTAVMAQSGGLTVRVVDSNGPLPAATVTISHETGFVKETAVRTNVDGIAEFPVLRPGQGYTIEVSFPGFGTQRLRDQRVQINKNTVLTVQLSEELTERVKVTAEGDVVDLEKTTTSTKFSDEFIQDLPVPGRFYQNVLTLAPGVQDTDGDGNPNVHGSRERDFKAVVSGISNVDPLTGGYMSQVNPNSIEEMEVITAGAGVEFSRAQGGFARILQKQGSNEFEGVVEFYFRSSLLDGTGANDLSGQRDPEFDTLQPSLNLSGPVIKDRLWYRLSHEQIDREDPVNTTGEVVVTTTKQGIHSDQLTWQVSPRNKLAFQFQSDPLKRTNVGVNSLVPAESSLRTERTGETYSLTWTAPFSPKILIESQVAWQDLNVGQFPSVAGIQNDCVQGESLGPAFEFLASAYCRNFDTGTASGSWFRQFEDHRQRLTMRGDATVYGGRFWGMSHQFKVGFATENERYFRHLERNPSFGFFVRSLDDESGGGEDLETVAIIPATVAIPQISDITATSSNWGVYAEDQIKPLQNLTITLGVRLDREELNSAGMSPFSPGDESLAFLAAVEAGTSIDQAVRENFTAYENTNGFLAELADTLNISRDSAQLLLSSAAQQSVFWENTRRPTNLEIVNTNFAPRLSISWDPWSNGKTKFAVAGGRYYDKIFLAVPLIELEPITTTVVYQATFDQEGQLQSPQLRSSVSAAANAFAVDPNLKTPYNDEYTLTFERELWAETSLSLTYINRKFRDQLQDVDINYLPGDFGFCRRASVTNPGTITPSPGEGQEIVDPYTGEVYIDTDPGIGDGYIAPGLTRPFDDCAGSRVPLRTGDSGGGGQGGQLPQNQLGGLQRPDRVPDLYLQNPGWGSIYWVSNLNRINYDGFVLELTRRQYRSWELQGSYTFSKARGDGEDFNQGVDDDQSQIIDARGYQRYDQRHVVKLNATTITPWGFRLGTAVTWQSGQPYSLLNQDLSFDQVPPPYENVGSGGDSRVRFTYEDNQRNNFRNISYWNVDLKFTKEMNLGRGLNMQLSAEIFNLLNDGTYFIDGFQVNGNNQAFRNFGRQWQLGMKLAF